MPNQFDTNLLPASTDTYDVGSVAQRWRNLFIQTVKVVAQVFSGSSSGTTTLQASAVASGTLTLPAATDTLVGKATADTLTNKTLTSPVINGSPTGTGVPTLTLKKGTGLGNYTSASTSYVRVDSTNLAYTVSVPTGWKLLVQASGTIGTATAAVSCFVALADGSADNTGVVAEALVLATTTAAVSTFSLGWVLTGDGNSHTFNLQYKTSNAADSVTVVNSTATLVPTMTFILSPSN